MKSQQPEFGRRLRHRRTELGLSQRQLAADFATASYISLLEAGRRSPTLDVLIHLAKMLDMPVDQLSGQDVAVVQDGDSRSAAMTQALVDSAVEAGAYDQAKELLGAALESAYEKQNPHRALEIGLQLQGLLRAVGRTQDRLALLEQLISLDVVADSPQLQAMLHSDLATARRDAGQLVPARKSAYMALAKISSVDLSGSPQHVRLLGILISILCELNELGQVEALVEEMLAVARSTTSDTRGRARWVASIACAQLGQHEAAYQHLMAARETLISPATPIRDWLRFARSAANVLLTAGKDLDAAQEWLENAEMAIRTLDLP
ncbi:MAG: helix-turn-helix domain-containing protein, partial [Pseudonocardiaceae bacterium]